MKTKFLPHVAGLCFVATGAFAETPVLTVYTYDGFNSDWGPGPQIEANFEAECGCDLEFVAAGDGASVLSRLKLEGSHTEADIVVGLDTNLTADALATGLFAHSGVSADFDLPIEWTDEVFVPFDWSYFAFVAGKDIPAPANFKELADSDISIVIQDPRSSTPGLGLVLWIEAAYGDEAADIWSGLADNIVTVTPGWSEAYGLFTEGEADAVLSYTTSPAYHLIAEEDDSKTSWAFEEGNYMQVEVAGKIASTDVPELADQFLAFIATDGFQSVIPMTNWMYPAVAPTEGLPAGFEAMAQPETALLFSAEEARTKSGPAIEAWRAALAQ